MRAGPLRTTAAFRNTYPMSKDPAGNVDVITSRFAALLEFLGTLLHPTKSRTSAGDRYRSLLQAFSVVLASSALLAACGGNTGGSTKSKVRCGGLYFIG
jgi:hypothetical protein